MPEYNKSKAPYYDFYNDAPVNANIPEGLRKSEKAKGYTQMLAVPGRVAQAREITQIQSTVKDIVKSIGDSILKDGDVIEGCQVLVSIDKRTATVTAGKVYLNGMVLPVSETSIAILGEGTETIGFKLLETLITEIEDDTLRDPAQGYDNFNQPGCHRIRSEAVIVRNDNDSAILATLIDGAISVENYAPEYDKMTQTLARRTYDESGSYIVEGLQVRVENTSDTVTNFENLVTIVVESGKAYVLGYELGIPNPRRFNIARSTEEELVERYYITYSDEETDYLLSGEYVKSVDHIEAVIEKTDSMSAPSNNTEFQVLKGNPRVYIDENNPENTAEISGYTYGTDYIIDRQGNTYGVLWKSTSNYPKSDYSVTYRYTHTFEEDVDYEVSSNDEGTIIRWLGRVTPRNNLPFYVTFNQYLARKDTIYINQYGDISAMIGTPAPYGSEIAPEAPMNTLAIATILHPPGGVASSTNPEAQIRVSNIGLTRFTMSDIRRLLDRIRTLEYDQTILSLNDEARQYNTGGDKRGIFTDPLIDFSRIGYNYNLHDGTPIDEELPTHDVTLDLVNSLCYLPTVSETVDLSYKEEDSTISKYNSMLTLAKVSENVVLSQMNATRSFLVNPYSMFPGYPEISISPSVDTWIEDTIIEVPVSRSTSEVVQSSTRNVEKYNTQGARRADTVTSSVSTTTIGTRVETLSNESVVNENSITYIRSRVIEVTGSQFAPDLTDIRCYFDGVPMKFIEDSEDGEIEKDTISSDNNGNFTAKFRIPAGKIMTGIREVKLESSTPTAGYENSAIALYQASGIARRIERTVTTLTTILLNRVTTVTTTHNIDPVGQTFVLDRMTLISGIDLYFRSAPATGAPVTCEIREVVNGTISSTIYGQKTLSAHEVYQNISSDSNKATRFQFDDPILLEANKEYAFVVRSTSPQYELWVAELGSADILTGETVLSNAYLIGVMLSSSNNSSWTTHQTTDIKFRLIEDTYRNSSDVIFNEVTGVDFSRIYLLASTLIPDNTSIDWAYRLSSDSEWISITPQNIISLNNIYQSITVRAKLNKTPDSNLSPMISLESVGLGLSSYDPSNSGRYYVSQIIRNLDPYTSVDVILDTYTPEGTSIEVWVMPDETTGELVQAPLNESEGVIKLNYGWEERTYTLPMLDEEATECRIFIKLNSSSKFRTPAFRRLRAIMSYSE